MRLSSLSRIVRLPMSALLLENVHFVFRSTLARNGPRWLIRKCHSHVPFPGKMKVLNGCSYLETNFPSSRKARRYHHLSRVPWRMCRYLRASRPEVRGERLEALERISGCVDELPRDVEVE